MEVTFSNKTNILEALLLTSHENSPIYEVKSTFGLLGRKITILKDVNPLTSNSVRPNSGRRAADASRTKEPVTVGAIHWREKVFEIHGVKKDVSDIKKKKGLLSKSRYWKWADDRKEYEVKHDGDKEWVVTYCPPPPSPAVASSSKSRSAKSKEPEPVPSKSKSKPETKRELSSSASSDPNSKSHRHPKHQSQDRTPSSTSNPETDAYNASHTHISTISSSSSDTALDKSPTHAGTFSVPYRPHLFSSKHPQSSLEEDEIFLILVLIYSEARRQEGMNSSVGSGVEGI
ncbi:hypothetical protein K435DRAFT_793574 [Dendrothele bispora CBS 962.96]|uniref:Uncharacterized protein n=1 Tax=Dendrothele bispora (strain CBS 962.96) TaxID=1314807 RepID=A0A4S8MF84_DENBC|nr:hypothetical protein K435DRAFT_793574 [Dendrothele bispora CBS 962.96]